MLTFKELRLYLKLLALMFVGTIMVVSDITVFHTLFNSKIEFDVLVCFMMSGYFVKTFWTIADQELKELDKRE